MGMCGNGAGQARQPTKAGRARKMTAGTHGGKRFEDNPEIRPEMAENITEKSEKCLRFLKNIRWNPCNWSFSAVFRPPKKSLRKWLGGCRGRPRPPVGTH
jgi:hypothetical protein